MEEIIKELKKITKEDVKEMIEIYEKMPDSILKNSMELTFMTWDLIKRSYRKGEENEVKNE